jgi:hypothetical protein
MHSYQEMRWYAVKSKPFSVSNYGQFVAELAIFAFQISDFELNILSLSTSQNIDDDNTDKSYTVFVQSSLDLKKIV